MSDSDLTPRQQFARNGFYGPFKVYEPDEAKQLLKSIRAKSIDQSNAIFQNECHYDRHFDIQELSDHIVNQKILDVVAEILEQKNLLCWRTEYFPKFPGSAGTEWHQVERFQYTTGTPQLQPLHGNAGDIVSELTVWTAFTESNEANGCMKFLPGSHLHKYYDEALPSLTGRNKVYSSIESDTSFFGYNFSDFKVDPNWEPNEDEAVSMIMEPGEAVVFTAKCVHGSFPNTTKNSSRFAITARYVSDDTLVYPNQDSFIEHGGLFDLSKYGVIAVKGKNRYDNNRTRTHNEHGKAFREDKRIEELVGD